MSLYFELWCWRRLMRVPWTARRSNLSILKEISPGCSLEGMMLKLKLQYFGHLMQRVDSLEKTLMLWKIEGRRKMGRQRMRWLDGITDSMDMSLSKLQSWWWTERPGMLGFMGSQRVGHDWATELNWKGGMCQPSFPIMIPYIWNHTLRTTAIKESEFSSVQLLSRVRLFVTPWTAARQASLFITNSKSSPKLMSIESVMPSNHLILCRPLLLLPSIFPNIRVFSNESALCIKWPKYWSFSFNISPSNEHPGLIFLRMGWLDLLAVQGTLKSLLWYHSSKASILWCSAFFMGQLSHLYMTTGKKHSFE